MGRSPCCVVEGIKKGAWTPEEDHKLISYIQLHGEGSWRTLPLKADLKRCGKSCRLRWANYLRPDIRRGEFSPEEDQKIIQLHATLGNRWSAIARHLSRRTDNEIKNYWNTHLKKGITEKSSDHLDTHKQIDVPNVTLFDSDNISDNNSNNGVPKSSDSCQKISQCESVDRSRSSMPLSASACLLNKLAANQPLSRCLNALRDQSQSFQSPPTIEGDAKIDQEVIKIINAPSNTACLKSPIDSRSASTSARVLNKMASRVSTSVQSLDTLKSILSKLLEGGGGGGQGGNMSESSSENMSEISRSNISTSSTTEKTINEMGTNNFVPEMDPFDLDMIGDWEGVLSSPIDTNGNTNGDTSYYTTINTIDSNYNIISPMSPSNLLKNNDSSFSIANEWAELFDFGSMDHL